jgi:hypothetical protein
MAVWIKDPGQNPEQRIARQHSRTHQGRLLFPHSELYTPTGLHVRICAEMDQQGDRGDLESGEG